MIYFVQGADGGPVKIGMVDGEAADVRGRVASLQCGNPVALKVLGVMAGGRAEEKALHGQFQRVRGEWYEADEALLALIAEKARPLPRGGARREAPLSFRWPADLVARIDAARGKVPRSAWVQEACEAALAPPSAVATDGGAPPSTIAPRAPERPLGLLRGRTSAQTKAGLKPIPKVAKKR